MTTAEKSKLRDEWRNLNLKLNQEAKHIKNKTSLGYKFSFEYLRWLKSLMNRRDYLTTIID